LVQCLYLYWYLIASAKYSTSTVLGSLSDISSRAGLETGLADAIYLMLARSGLRSLRNAHCRTRDTVSGGEHRRGSFGCFRCGDLKRYRGGGSFESPPWLLHCTSLYRPFRGPFREAQGTRGVVRRSILEAAQRGVPGSSGTYLSRTGSRPKEAHTYAHAQSRPSKWACSRTSPVPGGRSPPVV
jgi:hypothetical protein